MLRLALAMTTAFLASAVPAGAGHAADAPVKTYDVRDFFRKPERSYFRLAPDGRHLSFVARDSGRLNVFVQALDDAGAPVGEPKALTHESARDVTDYFWKGDDHIVYVKDFGGDENFHVLTVPIDGSGAGRDLTPYDGVRADIVDDLRDDPKHLLISHNRRDKQVFDVFRVDVDSGDATLVAQNPGNITGWVTDHAGRLRAGVVSDGVNSAIVYRDTEADPFRTIVSTDFRESVDPLFFTFDDERLYVNSNRGRDKKAIVEFDPKTSKEGRLVYENPDVDAAGLSFSRKRKVLTEATYVDWKVEHKMLDPETAAIYADLAKQLPGYEITLQSATKDETRFVVAASSDRTQGARYVYDAPKKSLTKLGDIQPWLSASDMAPMKPVTYRARDGLTIHGYLTLPVGRPAKHLPVVVNPHGGPWARDIWGFNPEVQFLANRGYAVLQMNFRGSTGYGRTFWEKSFREWGRTMQDDITDGVEWLKQQGIADPKRIAIYGGSYGGYATLAGVTFTPDLYAAAVDYVGVANLLTFMNTIPPYWEPVRQQFYAMVGDPVKDTADARGRVAGQLRRPHPHAAVRRAGRARPARQQGRERPDRRGAAQARRRGGVHGQGQRGPRLPQRGEPVRLLRRDGEVPRAVSEALSDGRVSRCDGSNGRPAQRATGSFRLVALTSGGTTLGSRVRGNDDGRATARARSRRRSAVRANDDERPAPDRATLDAPSRTASRMERSAFFDNLQDRLGKLLDETPAADLRNNLRALLQQAFERFDLATREQLDLQAELLARAQGRIADLEARIGKLEAERTPAAPMPLQDSPIG